MFELTSYRLSDCVSFRKTDEEFGGLSNMAGGFPLFVNKTRVLTSEHLYQASRFPEHPDIQRLVLAEKSPMSAKMKTKPHRASLGRTDWESNGPEDFGVRIEAMRWCLRLKLAANLDRFHELLEKTGNRFIVEESATKDTFWGTVKSKDGSQLVGQNVLGVLLMELRERARAGSKESLRKVSPPPIDNFKFLGQAVTPRE
jgi:type I restriction enzyme S subunit